jgi:ATP-dependent helicase/nuclease subunit B
MSMAGRWVRYGNEASEALRAEIARAKGAEPLAPVTVVVPSNQVGVSARRQLAKGGLGPGAPGTGIIGVTFLTTYRLAELLGAGPLAGAGRHPVSTPVLTAVVRGALRAEPGLFRTVAEHPATESALVATYRELRDLSPAALGALARQGDRAAEVARLHRAARSALEGAWYDEEDLLASATAAVAAHGGPAELGTVVVHLPQLLSRHAAELVTAVAAHHPVVVLAGTTDDTGADAEVSASITRLGLHLDPGAPRFGAPAVAADRTSIVTASDADEEVRHAVRRVVDAVRAGTPLDRIALFHASPEPYARLVREHLVAAGITANGAGEVPVAGRMAGRALLELLALPELGFRRQDVFAWLGSAPILHEGRWAPTTSWERISRDAGLVGGRREWDAGLESFATRLDADAQIAEDDPERPDWQAERKRTQAERARRLRRFVVGLADRLADAAAEPRAWSAHAAWARRLFEDLLGGPSRRSSWPDPERKAAERVELALDRLAALDRVEGAVGLDVFHRTLAIELEADLGRVGRFGEGVLVGPVSMAIGLDLDLVVLLGMAEGTFPAAVKDDSLLPDAERADAGGELPLRADHVHRLHRHFIAALATAPVHLLGVPRGDLRRSSERVPSRWVLDVASELAGERWWGPDLLAAREPWIHHVASFDAGVRGLAFPATGQEHRLRSLLAAAPERADLRAVAGGVDPVLGAGVAALDARHSADFTRFDGNLAGLPVYSPVDSVASATSLERWAKCPHSYLMQTVLRVEPVDHPEEALRITPMDRGSLVHQILEDFVTEVLERPEPDRPGPDQAWSAADGRRLAELAEAVFARYEAEGLTGRPIFWRRDRVSILQELDRFLVEDSAHRRTTRSRPVAAELAFGLRGIDPVPFPLPDGRSVPMRGMADRVDRGDDGTLHVVDYKTGSPDKVRVTAEDPHERGRRLQLAVYGQAARARQGTPGSPVEATYWFVSKKGRFQRWGYAVTPEVVERVGQAMQTIVTGIERGVFVPHPGPPSTSPWPECEYCDPDGLGTGELRRQWLRMAGHPDLADYVALAEPPGTDGDGPEEAA